MLSCCYYTNSCHSFTITTPAPKHSLNQSCENCLQLSLYQIQHPILSFPLQCSLKPLPPPTPCDDEGESEKTTTSPKLNKWVVDIGPNLTESQKQAISQLPPKMTKRCKALIKRIICFSPQQHGHLSLLLSTWVHLMKPRRADWLAVIKELKLLGHPLLLEVMELALQEESFEANIRDYTKLTYAYGKLNRLQDAENMLIEMKKKGFTIDQVSLTVLIDMYSKAGILNRAEEIFEELRLLGQPLDKRAYGSMIMAYIRAGMLEGGESLMREMEAVDIYAGREVYKALLRAYSNAGDAEGAQRIFGAIQFAGIVPDAKHSALLMNAYCMAGQSGKARTVLENLRRARIAVSDKCVALIVATYEKENNLSQALNLLMDLEKDGGFLIGKEAASVLAKWFQRIGIVDEVENVLRDYTQTGDKFKFNSCSS